MITIWKNIFYLNEHEDLPLKGVKYGRRGLYAPVTHFNAMKILESDVPIEPDALAMCRKLNGQRLDAKKREESIYYGLNNPMEIEGKYPPYDHQKKGISAMLKTDSLLLNADCGLGKTYMAIMMVNELYKDNPDLKVLVVCPKSLIKSAWIEDIEKFSNLPYANLRKKKRPEKPVFFIINYELLARRDIQESFDILILDESSKIKSSKTKNFQAVLKIAEKTPRRYLLSGSPMPNSIEDLWSQFFVIDFGVTLSRSHRIFMELTHREIKTDNAKFYVPTNAGKALVKRAISKRIIRFKKEDIKDFKFPKKVYKNIEVELSSEQRKVYKQIKEEGAAILADGDYVMAPNILTEISKLLQITGGFLAKKNKPGEPWPEIFPFKKNPKIDALKELVASIDDQIIIWAWYRHEVELIAKTLKCPHIYGAMSQKEFDKNLNAFKNKEKRILVANHATIGHGHTLTNAHYMIYYSNSYNYELLHQTEDRIHRLGQDSDVCFYYNIIAKNTINEVIAKALQSKRVDQERITQGCIAHLKGK